MKIIQEISWLEFVTAWQEDHDKTTCERHPEPEDGSSRERLEAHKLNKGTDFTYQIVELDEKDIERLLLPHHDHTIRVPPGGFTVPEYGKAHASTIFDSEVKSDDCVGRIRRAMNWFSGQKNTPLFMYVSDDSNTAMGNSFRGREIGYLYAGSSHKFGAYSAWIERNGFQPLLAYLVRRKGV